MTEATRRSDWRPMDGGCRETGDDRAIRGGLVWLCSEPSNSSGTYVVPGFVFQHRTCSLGAALYRGGHG